MLRSVLLVFAVAAAGVSCVSATDKEPVRVSQTTSGEDLYARDCAWCHGSDAMGTARGPAIDQGTASVDFMLSTGRMPIADVDARLVRSEPAYTTEQIEAIVDYTASIVSGPPVPEVHPGRGDAGFGAELYEQNCAACHSSTGVGAALTSGVEAPGIEEATPVQVAEAMLTGPGAMPVFGPETLSEHETNSLLRYVQTLQSTPDRGGSDLGGFGPVTEGAVAWLVGLGVCLLVVRWIGKRASE